MAHLAEQGGGVVYHLELQLHWLAQVGGCLRLDQPGHINREARDRFAVIEKGEGGQIGAAAHGDHAGAGRPLQHRFGCGGQGVNQPRGQQGEGQRQAAQAPPRGEKMIGHRDAA